MFSLMMKVSMKILQILSTSIFCYADYIFYCKNKYLSVSNNKKNSQLTQKHDNIIKNMISENV